MNSSKLISDSAKNLGILSDATSAWSWEPVLETLTLALADYTGSHCIAEDGKPLIDRAIFESVTAFHKSLENEESEERARAVYIKTLLDVATEIFNQLVVVETPSGGVMWSPYVSGLPAFIKQYPDANVTVTRKPSTVMPSLATMFLMTKILPHAFFEDKAFAELFAGTTAPARA